VQEISIRPAPAPVRAQNKSDTYFYPAAG